jgi:hypothetical protein
VTLKITEKKIISDTTPHYAFKLEPGGLWRVSWLPGQDLDRNSAISATTVAELTAAGRDNASVMQHIDGLAAEVGLCASDAIVLTSAPPMYPLLFTSVPGLGRDGYLASSTHVLWFESPEERDRFTACHFVASSCKPEQEG